MEEPNSLRHDQLIIEIITTTGQLTETLIREGKTQLAMLDTQEGSPEAIPRQLDPKLSIRLARLEWQRARVLARAILNPTYRSEYLGRVAEGLGRDSSRIVLEYVRRTEQDNLPPSEKLTEADTKQIEQSADDFLSRPSKFARKSSGRSGGTQHWSGPPSTRANRGSIPGLLASPAASRMPRRGSGAILVAESQCRHSPPEEATKTYAEVAEAVARVEQDGLRGVLTGYLVDSLISTGRFEDALACLVLYPTASERFVAMGAIAESEARRGSAERARQWIGRECAAGLPFCPLPPCH